jgi:mono/diheme cytochrome c family protein
MIDSTWVRVMSALDTGLASLIIVIVALTGGNARAQGLDEGKSGAKLFTAVCADCHHSPRGLAKGRFSWTLSYFLQQHYTSGAASAQALTAYLQSVDAPPAKPHPGRPAASASLPPLRPPAPVPGH